MRTGCSPTQTESYPSCSADRATCATPSASASAPDPTPNHPMGSIGYTICALRWRRACALPTWVMTSTTNANATKNQPKPVTPLIGAYAMAQTNVVHGRKMNPSSPHQNESKAMLIRSVKSQTKKIANRGEMNAANATMQPHMGGRLSDPAAGALRAG